MMHGTGSEACLGAVESEQDSWKVMDSLTVALSWFPKHAFYITAPKLHYLFRAIERGTLGGRVGETIP